MNEVRQFDDGLEVFDMDDLENQDIYHASDLQGRFLQSQSGRANICNGFVENIDEHFMARNEPQTVFEKSGKLIEVCSNNFQKEISRQTETREGFSETDIMENDFMSSDSMLDNRNTPVGVENAARERSRVKTLRGAFLELQRTLPAVPPDTKLSKLDVLVLATTYIAHLMRTLNNDKDDNQLFAAHGIMHPVKVGIIRTRDASHPL